MNFYPFHLGDYSSHTKHLTLLEDLAYRRMLDLYYTLEKPLPLEPEKVARLIGMRDNVREVSDVLSDFFLKSEDGYRNARCDKEIDIYKAKAERAKSANKSRWAANKSDTDLKSDLKSESDQIPTNNQEPIPIPLTKTSNKNPSAAKSSPLVEIPDWIPLENWNSFIEMRREKKKPATGRAMELIIKKLEAFKNDGHDIAGVLNASICNNWTDVYEPKVKLFGGKSRNLENFKALAERMKNGS